MSPSATVAKRLHRRTALALTGVAAFAAPAAAAFPDRPIVIVVPFPPGGGVDAAARAIAEGMAADLGIPVQVDNRPGGTSSIGAGYVARSSPDGATLLLGTTSLSINPVMQPTLPPGDPRTALAPVGQVLQVPYMLAVGPTAPAGDAAALIAWARAHPGRLDFANGGSGSGQRMSASLLAFRAGIEVSHVPYRGAAPAVIDLAAGRVHALFAQPIEVAPVLQAGTVRAVAVSTATRSRVFPEVPALAETLPGFNVGSWSGLFAAAGTPEPVLDRLNAALNAAMRNDAMRARFQAEGAEFVGGTRAAFAALLDREIRGWIELQRATGLTVD
ncbi:tripartite tricarboxylate transporter substrate-binding protein [Roseomonas sp. CAU 1739]|uniref:tripartite tricarboxylate transporter substrate-binding protein n=1 Tax=Roseomonas sp. CAU 1739 TaxID=3140364 RepID=UPI00325AFFE8